MAGCSSSKPKPQQNQAQGAQGPVSAKGSTSGLTLGYWPIQGRLETIRQLCALHGIQFQEQNPSDFQAWGQKKTEMITNGHPLANLPYLQEGQFTLFESSAIMRHVARKVPGMLGKTPNDEATVEMYTSFLSEIPAPLEFIYGMDNNEAKAPVQEAVEKKIMPKIQLLSQALGTKTSFLGYPTLVDHLAWTNLNFVSLVCRGVGMEVSMPENLKKFVETYNKQAKLVSYMGQKEVKERPIAPPGMCKFRFE